MRISDWSSDVCSSDLLARGYHVDSFIKTLGCLWNDLALFDQLRDPPLDAIGRDTFLAQVDRGLNYVGRFEHRLALTQNTNGAGSGILGARGSRRPRALGETGIDERIVRAAQIVDQPVAAVRARCTSGHYDAHDRRRSALPT